MVENGRWSKMNLYESILLNRVFCITVGILCNWCTEVCGIEYNILGLVPLSGEQSTKGWAQWQGMKLAIEEGLYTVNAMDDVQATFVLNDTKCNAFIEQQLIIDAFWKLPPERHLVVIGGGCPPSPEHISLGALYSKIPQVLFEKKPVRSQESSSTIFPVTIRADTEAAVFDDIARFVHLKHWRKLILIHDNNNSDLKSTWLHVYGIRAVLNINVSVLRENDSILKNSGFRVVVLLLDYNEALDIICRHYKTNPFHFMRYIWLLIVKDAAQTLKSLQESCFKQHTPNSERIIFFQAEEVKVNQKASQIFSHVVASDLTLASDVKLQVEAAYGYDTTTIVLNCLRAIGGATTGSKIDVVKRIAETISGRRWLGVTGNVNIDEGGYRRVRSQIYSYINDGGQVNKLIPLAIDSIIANIPENMERDSIYTETKLEGIPLSLFVIMCTLAGLGIVYAIAIMIFNIMKRDHRIIKMTSPNINVVIMFGCCGVYAAMVMLGLDTTMTSPQTMEKLIQAATYAIVMGFSVVYGLVSAKSWRIFMIFKNLTTNGKMTRDEHLLLGLFIMMIFDLAVLIPWHLLDPITCSKKAISEVFEPVNMTDVTTEVDVCSSTYQNAWVAAIYVYKAIVLGLGFFFSWQTRHVTLPALRDTRMIHITICLVIIMALVALPLLVVGQSTGIVIRYAVGSLILWLTTTFTITLLFLNKVFLYRKEAKRDSQTESFRFQFTESMKRTQEALRKLAGCLCCGVVGEDKYAQEMLLTEIECLKRTIKDKDVTIRELNDRLYVGAQKFHEYLKTPTRQPATIGEQNRQRSTLADHRQGDQDRHATCVSDDQTNAHLGIASGGTNIMAKPHGSATRVAHSQSEIPQQSYRHASLNRHSNGSRESDTNYCLEERRFRAREARAVAFHQGTNASSVSNAPVYTIEVHRPRLERAAASVYSTPDKPTNPALYHREYYRPKSSPNFDSAIDSNSPSSSSSGSYPNTRESGQEPEQFVIDGTEPMMDIHAHDGGIDLEAIEQEVANSQQHWTDGIPVCADSGDYTSRQQRNMPRTRSKQEPADYRILPRIQYSNNQNLKQLVL